jgi:ABC-2 type transport system ATP-binding protein
VSFAVEPGQLLSLLGPNGAGKSTTVAMIAGLVPQGLALYDELSATANLRLFGALYGLAGQQLEAAIGSALLLVGLTERAGERVKTFSGGMKRGRSSSRASSSTCESQAFPVSSPWRSPAR